MFVSGAAALGAGAVFTGLAVHSEDRAQMFLDRQRMGMSLAPTSPTMTAMLPTADASAPPPS